MQVGGAQCRWEGHSTGVSGQGMMVGDTRFTHLCTDVDPLFDQQLDHFEMTKLTSFMECSPAGMEDELTGVIPLLLPEPPQFIHVSSASCYQHKLRTVSQQPVVKCTSCEGLEWSDTRGRGWSDMRGRGWSDTRGRGWSDTRGG